jgi:hypothetical protein
MATLTKTIAAPATHITDITIPNDATIVHIGVRQVNGRYTLGVFPSRRGDTRAFYSDDPAQRSVERPRQVVWVAHDLPNKMKLEIKAKPKVQDLGLLEKDLYTITTQTGPVASLPVLKEGTWSYDVRLVQGSDVLASIDPDIVVRPDP